MEHADLVLRGAPVYTVDPGSPWARAVAVSDGVISAVGSEADIAPLIGPDTRVIDVPADHLVLPGFIDSHSHLTEGPFEARGIDLSECDTYEEIRATIEAADRDGDLIVGGGWRSHIFPLGPNRDLLDEVFGDTPVILREINSHSLWVNGAALAAAGVTRETPDPTPGYSTFGRDDDGELTGWVLEDEAMRMVRDAIAPPSVDVARRALIEAQAGYAAAGLTGHYDPGIFVFDERAGWEMLCELDREGLLNLRVAASKAAIIDPVDAVEVLAAANREHRSPQVRVNTLKVFVDGVTEAHTSAYLEPYSDRPGTNGPLAASEEDIHRWADEADAAGFICHFHALGDQAVRVALDAVEAARAKRASGVTHAICHATLIDSIDLPRFRELDVVYQTSSQWIAMDPFHEVMLSRLGEDRAERQYPLRTAVESGIVVTLGSDYPASSYVSTYRPLVLIESAVTRRLAGVTDGDGLPPADEALSLPDAIRGMTASAAYQVGLGNSTGMLRPGMHADIVVLGRNLFDIPSHEIAATPVVMTMVGGRTTHEAGS
ncbi:amidohydrolase [bacterium]|nr:amidohydrolase [bacterium]